MILPFQGLFWDCRQDALAEIAAAVVHIKTCHREDNPIAVLLPVGVEIGNQIAELGGSLLPGKLFYRLPCFFWDVHFVVH